MLVDTGIVIKNVILLVPWALVSWMIEQIFISTKMIILISMLSMIQKDDIYIPILYEKVIIFCLFASSFVVKSYLKACVESLDCYLCKILI